MNKIFASILKNAIKESLTNYESKEDSNSLSSLYLYHDNEDNSFVIYDDRYHVLNKVQFPVDRSINLFHLFRQVLHQLGKERFFERDYILKPFTVSLVDKDFLVLEELLFIDDDAIKTNDTIWTSIEKDLDDFLRQLLQ